MVQHHSMRHQLRVAYALAWCVAMVLADHPVTPKGHPLDHPMPGFRNIGRRVDRPAPFPLMDAAEEKSRPHDTAQGAEGHNELVLPAVRAEFAEHRGAPHLAWTDRERHPQPIGQMGFEARPIAGL